VCGVLCRVAPCFEVKLQGLQPANNETTMTNEDAKPYCCRRVQSPRCSLATRSFFPLSLSVAAPLQRRDRLLDPRNHFFVVASRCFQPQRRQQFSPLLADEFLTLDTTNNQHKQQERYFFPSKSLAATLGEVVSSDSTSQYKRNNKYI